MIGFKNSWHVFVFVFLMNAFLIFLGDFAFLLLFFGLMNHDEQH